MDITTKNNSSYSQITDVGCVRELNEDSLFCSEGLWLVADGMGGHACGEIASQLAAQEISDSYARNGELAESIQLAHDKIVEAGKNGVGQSGMGTTVVALTTIKDSFEIAWVGDSRAYLWDMSKNKLTQLTEDHSLIVRLVKSGLISVEDAKTHPQRHMITQCLGSVEISNLQVDTYKAQWKAKQKILLCSDGLSDDVDEQQILQALQEFPDNEARLSALVKLAKKAGGKDNISLIIVDSPVSEPVGFLNKIKSLLLG